MIISDELSFCIFLLHLLHAIYIDVEITPATDPSTLVVIESSETVNVGAKANILACGSVAVIVVPLFAVLT